MNSSILRRLSSSKDGTIDSAAKQRAQIDIETKAKLEQQRSIREMNQINAEKTKEIKVAVERQKRLDKCVEAKRIRESARLIAMLARRAAIADQEKKKLEEAIKKQFLENEEKLRAEVDRKAKQEKVRRTSLENIRLSQIENENIKNEEISKKLKHDRERIMKIEWARILLEKTVEKNAAMSRANDTKKKESKKWIT
jgi:hypothetical protein